MVLLIPVAINCQLFIAIEKHHKAKFSSNLTDMLMNIVVFLSLSRVLEIKYLGKPHRSKFMSRLWTLKEILASINIRPQAKKNQNTSRSPESLALKSLILISEINEIL